MCEAAIPGIPWRHIAKSAYRAFVAVKKREGYFWAEFDDLSPLSQKAWEAAVRQAGDCQAKSFEEGPPDENRWRNWIPPHLKGDNK